VLSIFILQVLQFSQSVSFHHISTPVFPCQYLSTTFLYTSSFTNASAHFLLIIIPMRNNSEKREEKITLFKKVRTETILKIHNTLVLPTFLYESENWTLTALQRRRTEAAEMKLLRPVSGYTLYDHKTNDCIRLELQITGILDKIDEYRRNWLSHLQRMPQNRIPFKSYHYRPRGRRTIGRPKERWREQL